MPETASHPPRTGFRANILRFPLAFERLWRINTSTLLPILSGVGVNLQHQYLVEVKSTSVVSLMRGAPGDFQGHRPGERGGEATGRDHSG